MIKSRQGRLNRYRSAVPGGTVLYRGGTPGSSCRAILSRALPALIALLPSASHGATLGRYPPHVWDCFLQPQKSCPDSKIHLSASFGLLAASSQQLLLTLATLP